MKITAIKSFMTREGRRSRVLCKVETDEGIYGWGECYSPGPDLAIEPTLDYIFELIKGEDVLDALGEVSCGGGGENSRPKERQDVLSISIVSRADADIE